MINFLYVINELKIMEDFMTKQVSTATIYLGTPFYNDDQRARVKKAMELLEKNPTVVRVHFPFDQNFVDPEEKNPIQKKKIQKSAASAAWLGVLQLTTMTSLV